MGVADRRADPMDAPNPVEPGCGKRTVSGALCRCRPAKGADMCRLHGAAAPQVARRTLVKRELQEWGLTDTTVDPGTVLLRLVAQSSRRVEFLAGLLAESYAAAEAGASTTTLPA